MCPIVKNLPDTDICACDGGIWFGQGAGLDTHLIALCAITLIFCFFLHYVMKTFLQLT